MTRPGLRLLLITVLALAVGFFTGLRAAATFTPSHHRWMAPPLPANLAFRPFPTLASVSPPTTYPRGGDAHDSGTPPLLRDTRPGLTIAASGWAAVYEPDPSAAGRYATNLRDQGDGAGRVPASGGLTGYATWYAGPDCLCAAAGPDLRHGDWRGSTVTVSTNGRLIRVVLVDACACGDRHGQPTLLDLSLQTVHALNLEPRKGVYQVTVTWP